MGRSPTRHAGRGKRWALYAAVPLIASVAWPVRARADDIKAQCIAASDQGQSLRDDGKYKKARQQFQLCARDACPRIVARLCTQWAHEVDENMPSIVVGVKDGQGGDVLDAQATLDGQPIGPLDGKPILVDPGVHVVRATRQGGPPAEDRIVVRASEKSRVLTLTLALTAAKPAVVVTKPEDQGHPADAGAVSGARIATTAVLGAVGLAGIGAAIYLGLHSSSEANTASSLRGSIASSACAQGSSQVCQNLGNAVDAQNRDAIASRVLYGVGGVLAAGALTVFLAWPKAHPTEAGWIAPWAAPGTAGIAAGTRF